MGKNLVIIGIVIVVIGLLYMYFPKALTWFGKLPGDIRIDKPNTKVFFPITSLILVSIVFNLVLYVIRKL